jgi:hypothetical protein
MHRGDAVVNKSLTIVLPVYNGESRLRSSVREILELASELTPRFGVLIIDDGSTDSSYEVAEELSARYPQVSVRRNREQRGLGPAIEYVQRSVRSDAVIIHDGVTPIDANQLRSEWRRWMAQQDGLHAGSATPLAADICDFANLPAIHAQMERAHGRMIGFQLLATAQTSTGQSAAEADPPSVARTDAPHASDRTGLGQIPPLPRPKFLTSVAAFALGE